MAKPKIKPEHCELAKKVFLAGKTQMPAVDEYIADGVSEEWWGELHRLLNDDHIDNSLKQIAKEGGWA